MFKPVTPKFPSNQSPDPKLPLPVAKINTKEVKNRYIGFSGNQTCIHCKELHWLSWLCCISVCYRLTGLEQLLRRVMVTYDRVRIDLHCLLWVAGAVSHQSAVWVWQLKVTASMKGWYTDQSPLLFWRQVSWQLEVSFYTWGVWCQRHLYESLQLVSSSISTVTWQSARWHQDQWPLALNNSKVGWRRTDWSWMQIKQSLSGQVHANKRPR